MCKPMVAAALTVMMGPHQTSVEATMTNLKGKIAWITGAGSGIGLAGAQALAEAGATVVLSGRRAEPLEREAAAIAATGG